MRQHGALKRECRQQRHQRRKGNVGKHEGKFEALQRAKTRVYHPVDFHLKALLRDGYPRHSKKTSTHIYTAGKTAEICNNFKLSASTQTTSIAAYFQAVIYILKIIFLFVLPGQLMTFLLHIILQSQYYCIKMRNFIPTQIQNLHPLHS